MEIFLMRLLPEVAALAVQLAIFGLVHWLRRRAGSPTALLETV
jgi:hypothetical protein